MHVSSILLQNFSNEKKGNESQVTGQENPHSESIYHYAHCVSK